MTHAKERTPRGAAVPPRDQALLGCFAGATFFFTLPEA